MMKKTLLRRLAFLSAVVLVRLTAFSVADAAEPDPAKVSDPWQPLRVLVGSWEGEAKGEPGSGKNAREYRFTLNDRFIHATSRTTYPPQEKNPKGEVHEDVGFISYDKTAKKLVMRQFHVEGFVNHYVVESISEDGRTIVFVTVAIENIPAGWRGRETYRILSDDEFVETFALAEPGRFKHSAVLQIAQRRCDRHPRRVHRRKQAPDEAHRNRVEHAFHEEPRRHPEREGDLGVRLPVERGGLVPVEDRPGQ
jgi:hypothetical protein